MMATRLALGLAAVALAAGCVFGPRPENFGPARGPEGVEALLFFDPPRSMRGELLEVRDSTMLVLVARRVTLVRFDQLRAARFQLLPRLDLNNGRLPSERGRAELRLVSRFPYGLTPELEATLLASYRQDRPDQPVP